MKRSRRALSVHDAWYEAKELPWLLATAAFRAHPLLPPPAAVACGMPGEGSGAALHARSCHVGSFTALYKSGCAHLCAHLTTTSSARLQGLGDARLVEERNPALHQRALDRWMTGAASGGNLEDAVDVEAGSAPDDVEPSHRGGPTDPGHPAAQSRSCGHWPPSRRRQGELRRCLGKVLQSACGAHSYTPPPAAPSPAARG